MPPSRAVAASLSVLLHVLLVLALLHATTVTVEPPQFPPAQEAGADRLRDAGQQIISVDVRPGLSLIGLACSGSSYVGVGITADPRTQRVILVGERTPASRAGLQHDDIVLNPDVWRDAHQEGILLPVVILREGVTMTLPVRVGRICID